MILSARATTFLFTDMEGSTLLWETQPLLMAKVLARHDTVLRQIIEESGGAVFKTMGDAFLAAFQEPTRALMCAVEAQLGLSREPWPLETPVRVRMAVHTGVAETRGQDYFGPPL